MIFPRFVLTGLLFLVALSGALVAFRLGMPMPFMMGSLLTTALAIALFPQGFPERYVFAPRLRTVMLAVIGVAIGAQMTPEIVARAPEMALSLLGVLLFVPIAHGMNYVILRRFAQYPPNDALFSASPGGFVESITLAEEYGADVKRVTIQHFLRVILVILIVPLALSIYLGHPIGVARGNVLALQFVPPVQIALIANVALAGFLLARFLRIPAGMLTGPLFIAALIAGFGGPDLSVPTWFVALAQVVVGTALGVRFQGLTRKQLVQSTWWCLITVIAMLALAAVFANALHRISGLSFESVFISYAPGGLTEMGLIALSLSANSAVVVFHHLLRIIATVLQMTLYLRYRRNRRV